MREKHIVDAIAKRVHEELKSLLETKHLYQSVTVTEDSILDILPEPPKPILLPYAPIRPRRVVNRGELAKKQTESDTLKIRALLSSRWNIATPKQWRHAIDTGVEGREEIDVTLVSVKTRCGSCGQRSPMNLVSATDAASGIWDETGSLSRDDVSVYAFTFLCQDCRDGIEIFLVARKRNKMTLVGRSPMEHVDVPKFIPKPQWKYYSGAVIAFNSGQILPALFMLRVLIEQYVRGAVDQDGKADELLKAYMESLPSSFKSQFPSLTDVYSKLSDAIHDANEDAALFDDARQDIETHFDAKRLSKLE